jgi:hypothetical protein
MITLANHMSHALICPGVAHARPGIWSSADEIDILVVVGKHTWIDPWPGVFLYERE